MKLQVGKMYTCRDGHVTGPIERSLDFDYPFQDPVRKLVYTEEGRRIVGHEAQEIIAEYVSKAAEVLPCNEQCRKCGSLDVSRTFRKKGETWSRGFPKAREQSCGYSQVQIDSRYFTARKDCIVHVCRCCQYSWDGKPWSA